MLTITESFDTVSPAEFDRGVADGAFANYGVIILDEHTPRLLPPSVGALYFDPSGDQAPFRIVARAKKPAVVAVDEHHQVTHFVTLSSATFDDVEILDVDQARGDTALAITDMGTIIAAGTIAGRRVVACGFALGSTDLPLRTAFPLFLRNAMKWLAGKPQADSR